MYGLSLAEKLRKREGPAKIKAEVSIHHSKALLMEKYREK